ncbi:MAG: hypothetical protein ABWY11_15420 [Umezawaea sp.]
MSAASAQPSTLFDHALRLHRLSPDQPLPNHGEPFPGEVEPVPRRRSREPSHLVGADVAAIIDLHVADPPALADALRSVSAPIHRNDHIAAAALRADPDLVRSTGRWLVRRGTHRSAVAVGLALLAAGWDDEDVPLIRTAGLLSRAFGPLASSALERRLGGEEALIWLGDRVADWGRVYVVEALCRVGGRAARPWLLRRAVIGDALDVYYAGTVATAAHLHAAITAADVDDDLVDHTGRVLATMADCEGRGTTLDAYPPAGPVLEAFLGYFTDQEPTVDRYLVAGQIAHHRPEHRDRVRAVLDRDDWCAAVRAHEGTSDLLTWFARAVAPGLGLKAFAGRAFEG